MSFFKENTNSRKNIYLCKKREKESLQKENKPNFDNYYKYNHSHKNEKYEKYAPNKYCYNFKKFFPKEKYYYIRDYQNKRNNYSSPKKYYYRWNQNKYLNKRDYNNSYQNNFYGEIRNISNCDILSPQSIALKEKDEENSWNSFPCSTNLNSPIKSNNGFNSKKINKQDNLNNENDLKFSPSENKEKQNLKEENRSEEIDTEKEGIIKINKKIAKYKFFDRNEMKIEENPLKYFEIYPKNLFEFNEPKSIDKDVKNNLGICKLSLESCYLLAKIPNWRLVSKFVPIPSLKKENFEKILETSYEEGNITGKNKIMREDIMPNLVYFEKYENLVDGYLKENENKKKKIKYDIRNRKLISSQFQYDLLEIKNKIQRNKYELNFLKAQNDILCDAIGENRNS